MKHTLITSTGHVYTFYIKDLAEVYLSAYGGTLITDDVVDNPVEYSTEQ